MRLIDADALWMEFIHRMDYCDDILEIVEEMPEAVVRCKDCRYWKDQAEGVVEVPVCEYDCRNGKIGITQIMGAEDYCSHGERKTAESE